MKKSVFISLLIVAGNACSAESGVQTLTPELPLYYYVTATDLETSSSPVCIMYKAVRIVPDEKFLLQFLLKDGPERKNEIIAQIGQFPPLKPGELVQDWISIPKITRGTNSEIELIVRMIPVRSDVKLKESTIEVLHLGVDCQNNKE